MGLANWFTFMVLIWKKKNLIYSQLSQVQYFLEAVLMIHDSFTIKLKSTYGLHIIHFFFRNISRNRELRIQWIHLQLHPNRSLDCRISVLPKFLMCRVDFSINSNLSFIFYLQIDVTTLLFFLLMQIVYLQNLGCTIVPTSRLHASHLIEQYKSLWQW